MYELIKGLLHGKFGLSSLLVVALTTMLMQSANAQETSSSDSDEITELLEGNSQGAFDQNPQLELLAYQDPISFDDNTTDTPIDGGIGFLLAAGAGYVAHGLNRKRRRRNNELDEEADSTDQ